MSDNDCVPIEVKVNYKFLGYFIILLHLFFLSSCKQHKSTIPILSPVTFAELPNWQQDKLSAAWPAFVRSCQQLITLPADAVLKNISSLSSIQNICTRALAIHQSTEARIKYFFEENFTPYKVSVESNSEGLFTGYYEPVLSGSRIKTKRYIAPLYKKPNDLVTVDDLGIFRRDLKGIHLTGRVVNGHLQPYFTHAEIDRGILQGNELIWIEDPIDAFIVQIQGSATIKLDTGTLVHVAYAAANGHPYTAIGKVLIERKVLTRENMSMQSIRAWLKEHPALANEVLHQNASFVFFKESQNKGPIGDEGVTLTPGRSLAVDPSYISYGTPIWLDISHPTSARIQRLVIAQDKGGAIKGPIRGDVFWGTGKRAGELAGLMKSKGSYYLLLPNKI